MISFNVRNTEVHIDIKQCVVAAVSITMILTLAIVRFI